LPAFVGAIGGKLPLLPGAALFAVDTELELLVKNTLDALELTLPDPHPLAVLRWPREARRA